MTQNQGVPIIASEIVLDHDQFRAITLDDEELMREIMAALIADTSEQIANLKDAIDAGDREQIKRIAHYSKGACANVGAKAAASILQRVEQMAAQGNFAECGVSLAALALQVDRLRTEVVAI